MSNKFKALQIFFISKYKGYATATLGGWDGGELITSRQNFNIVMLAYSFQFKVFHFLMELYQRFLVKEIIEI